MDFRTQELVTGAGIIVFALAMLKIQQYEWYWKTFFSGYWKAHDTPYWRMHANFTCIGAVGFGIAIMMGCFPFAK